MTLYWLLTLYIWESSLCACGSPETLEHYPLLSLHCQLHEHHREAMIAYLLNGTGIRRANIDEQLLLGHGKEYEEYRGLITEGIDHYIVKTKRFTK